MTRKMIMKAFGVSLYAKVKLQYSLEKKHFQIINGEHSLGIQRAKGKTILQHDFKNQFTRYLSFSEDMCKGFFIFCFLNVSCQTSNAEYRTT